VKALYRSWAIPCAGKQVYAECHRAEWLAKISEPGVRRRAEFYYQSGTKFNPTASLVCKTPASPQQQQFRVT